MIVFVLIIFNASTGDEEHYSINWLTFSGGIVYGSFKVCDLV